MHLSRLVLASLVLAGSLPVVAQDSGAGATDQGIEIDFLVSYYDQDGEHSAVTGGTGTEKQQVISPVVLVSWAVNEDWSLKADLGIDQISAASVDHIDAQISSASKLDQRAFTDVTGTRRLNDRSSVSFTLGVSTEYDYQSVSAGLGYAIDFNEKNTTLSANVRHFADTVELYDIDGIKRGDDSRATTDVSLGLSQVLGSKTVGTVELAYTTQSGFLSTPFHEVVLPRNVRVAERLPDSRRRTALGLGLNHSFGRNLVQRAHYRLYDDDWGIRSHSISLETHFRLPTRGEGWLYPFLRYHTQTASDYFGPTGTFSGAEEFFTSDWDLGEVDTERYGLGLRVAAPPGQKWFLGIRRYEVRLSFFTRDDGLEGLTGAFGFGWTL